jgi:hypothetical protein
MAERPVKEEEIGQTETSEKPAPLWQNSVEDAPEYYASMAFIDETASEVTILFGSFFKEDPNYSNQLCKARVVMSHHSFVAFADRVTKEAQFLRKLYKSDVVPSLEGVSDSDWKTAFEEVYGIKSEVQQPADNSQA